MEGNIIKKLLHGEGPSRITMDSNSQIASCGHHSNSIVFHKGGIEEESYQFEVDGIINIYDIACYKLEERHLVAIATDDHTVLSYAYCSGNINDDPFAENEFNTLLIRFTAQINTLDINSDDTKLAAGASDFLVKLVDLTNTTKVSTLEGHNAPVLYVKFDPLNEYLASSSCDGTVKIWTVNEKVMIHSVDVFPKTNDIMFASTLCKLSWQPDQGQYLAVPLGSGVKIFKKKDNWNCVQTIDDKIEDKSDHVTCWSPCGQYLAVGSSDGSISVWVWPQCTLLSRHSAEVGVISSLYWDKRGTSCDHPLMFSTSSGYIGSLPQQWIYSESTKESESNVDDPLIEDSLLMEGIPPDSIFDDNNDEEYVSNIIVPLSDTNKTTNKRNNEDIIDNEIPPPKRHYMRLPDDQEDDESINQALSPWQPEVSSIVQNQVMSPVKSPEPDNFHEIFQPSATPSHLSHRFMVYNLVGIVRCHDDDSSPMVEVEFHSSSTHHPFSIPNHNGWSMASLSSKALVLATEKDDNELSQLHCIVFSSWDHNKDWSIQLPKKENIEVITLGDGWVAMATNKQFLRLYTLGGVQREVISLPGQVVTLNGEGDYVIIVYQETTMSSLTVWILDVKERAQLHPPHLLPLSAQAKLEWIGFSSNGVPVSYDSVGVVRVLSTQYQLSWLPVLDTTKCLSHKGDHYFVVGMTHNPNQMRVILCNGLNYPPIQPRPVMSTLSLSLPLCDPQTEKTIVEAQYLEELFIQPPGVSPSPTEILKPLMKMLALACHSNHEFRAFEVASMMTLDQGLELALQYASKSRHFRLARQISDLKERRTTEMEDDNDDYYHDNYEPAPSSFSSPHHPSSHSVSQNRSQRVDVEKSKYVSKVRRLLIPNNKFIKSNKENCETIETDNQEDTLEEEDGDISENGNSQDKESEAGIDEDNNEFNDTIENEPSIDCNSQVYSPQVNSQNPVNPFKMTTPVSKQIQVDRRSSFLDKISHEVEEKEREKQKKTAAINKSKLKPANYGSSSKSKSKKKGDTTLKLAAFSFVKET